MAYGSPCTYRGLIPGAGGRLDLDKYEIDRTINNAGKRDRLGLLFHSDMLLVTNRASAEGRYQTLKVETGEGSASSPSFVRLCRSTKS